MEEKIKNHPVISLILERARSGSKPLRRDDEFKLGLAIEGGAMRGVISAGMATALESLGLLPVFDAVYEIAAEISREGREGKPVGTTFVLGDTQNVLARSRQLILNPFEGHPRDSRVITNPALRETIKELAQLDGAFVITGDGVVSAGGRYITVDTSTSTVPKGLGTRHASVAGITQETRSVGIVVSQTGGRISVFKDGRIVRVITEAE